MSLNIVSSKCNLIIIFVYVSYDYIGPDWLDVKSSIDLFEQGMRKYGNRAR